MKHSSLLFSVIVFGSIFASQAAASVFQDVSDETDFANAIEYVKERNYVDGYPDGTYQPDRKINRYEFTKIIMGATTTETERSDCIDSDFFPDVATDQWFTPYICVAKQTEVINGYADGTFGGTNNVTLAEGLKIIFEAYGENILPATGQWYTPYMTLAETKDLLTNISSEPNHQLSRGEMAQLIFTQEESMTSSTRTVGELASAVEANNRTLGQCLNDAGAIFYGTTWCTHCNNQKSLLGDEMDLITFVDCDEERQICRQEGVTGYPTWKFADDTVLTGTQPLATLAALSECE
jgi:hypothetical protein